jgi:hypothetical protein
LSISLFVGYEGFHINLEVIGMILIDFFYDKKHEVVCYILKETVIKTGGTERIVIAFRGTASKKQMEDNMNYKKKKVNFHNLEKLYAIDMMDGLNFKETRTFIVLVIFL